ncbi:DNA excision repair protein ERCC-1 [Megalobrama amblycephala]|uniref:DNA excision repair protein ERCC-1 n=1 Tax=Megalobrama amblycephala TaxID=75352 RepID=UPI0020144104|nr:DNA excision repair protein ERCC-1 [Megalobrama amblycephala]
MEKKKFNINLDDSAFTKERSPVASLFKAKDGQVEASSVPASGQPLSYAEFVVQSKNRVLQGAAHGPEKQISPAQSRNDAAGQSSVNTAGSGSVSTSFTDSGNKPETEQQGPAEVPTDQTKEEGQSLESCIIPPHLLGSGNSIIVSPRQRGNPILKFVRNVPWEFGEVVPDYVLGRTTCALFLSVRYHNLNPNYIHERLKQLGQSFTLRVLLVQVDVKDPHHALKELARICIMADCTLILAWSPEEAGRYLETYKSYEKKPADLLKEQVEKNYLSQVTDCLTTVKSVNKTDAMTLLSTFSSLEGIIKASKEELVLCPGLGPQKARRLYDILHQPFVKTKKKESG